ncbi:hypothetical protein ScPMuIL_016183 [Solemya velum]
MPRIKKKTRGRSNGKEMAWRHILSLILGEYPEYFFSPVFGTFVYFIIVMGFGITVRQLNKRYSPDFLKSYVADFVSTMEMCGYFYENNNIMKHYGSVFLFIAIVIECLISNRTFEGASENPCKAFHELLMGRVQVLGAVVTIAIQTLAGLASYRMAQAVWSLDFVLDHRERFYETTCSSDLNTTLMVGLILEMIATLMDTWINKQTLHSNGLIDEVIKASNAAVMIILGIEWTGMYFNPAMASGHTFGCEGTAAGEHFLVYWLGPFIGCYLASIVDSVYHVDQSQTQADSEKKTN